MSNPIPSTLENAFARALETPVPPGLVENIRRAARRRAALRAWRRRAAWWAAPALAAAALAALFVFPRPAADTPSPRLARPASFHEHAQTLVSLAAGGTEFHAEADVHSLARDLLTLQGF